MSQEYTVKDIVRSAYEGNPSEVSKSVEAVMRNKMSDALDARRSEVVADVFGSSSEASKGEE